MIEALKQKNKKICTIDWQNEAQHFFSEIKRANILQSPEYGRAMAKLNNQRLRYGLISINNQKAGYVQILEAGILKNAVHAVICDRGPLWFEGFGSIEDQCAFLETFNKAFPKRLGRRLRFIPEMQHNPIIEETLKRQKFTKTSDAYQTYWLDITPDLETLRQNLKKNWRNTLTKAENESLQIECSDEGRHLACLIKHYERDKMEKSYDGPSIKTIIHLASEFSRGKNMLIATALFNDEPIAAILIFIHSKAATYQIGYTSDKGRRTNAHYVLLWRMINELKERGINEFDLGGVNEETAKGVKRFKTGMGGKFTETLGLYTR